MSWRDQKREVRRIVHRTMQIPAVYHGEEAIPVNIRLHTKFDAIGDDRSMGWAEMQVSRPRVIFMIEDGVEPQRGGVVFIQPGEAYFVDNVLPPDEISITAEVSRMTEQQLKRNGFPTLSPDEVAP